MPTPPYRSPTHGGAGGFSLSDGAFPSVTTSVTSSVSQQQQQPATLRTTSSMSAVATSHHHHHHPPLASPASSVVSTGSLVSTSSSYRHHQAAFLPQQTPASPRPVLLQDAHHHPKTLGSVGIMLVGLGGANGTTLLAGILANRLQMSWRGARGEEMTPNYYGCITQLRQRGRHGGVGYKDKVKGLADVSMAAVGGWDIRPDKLGDALLEAQILDYDLVRQLREEMNKVKVFRGLYDPRFIGTSQFDTATHVLSDKEAPTSSDALKCLRADIRYFKWRNGVVGHTTVIWSASVEPNCDILPTLQTAHDLLDALEMTEEERGGPLPPSIVYATAALLEGCSFVNGGSQNTLSCPGLDDLARQMTGVYCLGTDFKAGQTKFKTAAVEYLRTMGLTPKVIASSNHLGNNDMKNLASQDAASKAKLRVKHDIFEAWEEEDLDHKVSIMYTPFINDDKRDFVEYTSLGFLGQPHTMVTYTRASDSVLCVPLMIDAAVWCDFFSSVSWPFEKVAKALAYLFKVPEGAAKGVDPGFFHQMQGLDREVVAAHESKTKRKEMAKKRRVRIRPEEKRTEWAIPHDAIIICAGLACVDMQLNQASGGDGGESIETFEGETSIGGGSVSMACKTLARLCHGAPLDDMYMQINPPVVHSVVPLCKIGSDDTGTKLISLLEKSGSECRNVETKYINEARSRDPTARTALAVLPIYRDGRRGCFFDAASNQTFSSDELIHMLRTLTSGSSGPSLDISQLTEDDMESYRERVEDNTSAYGAFLFGYPHLLPEMQGEALADLMIEARHTMIDGGIVALDLNGVPEMKFERRGLLRSLTDLRADPVIGPALSHVDILHMNESELVMLTGCRIEGTEESQLEDDYAIASAANLFILSGVAVVAVTRGKKGSFVCCNSEERFQQTKLLPLSWIDCTARINAVELPPNTLINSNGAGDAFLSGLLVATLLRHTGMTVPAKPSSDASASHERVEPQPTVKRTTSPPKKKKTTPYALYMRENYVSLKKQCNDDKKAMFSKCHEMWENESDDVKVLYERRANDEGEEDVENEMSLRVMDAIETLDSSTPRSSSEPAGSLFSDDDDDDDDEEEHVPRNLYMTNRALNLESAVQFASLVAAYHVDVKTRELLHIDVSDLLERAMIFPHGLEEI